MQNWRTTVVGVLAGLGNLWATGAISGFTDLGPWAVSTGLAVLGILSKDFQVSGTINPNGAGKP